MYVYFWNLEGVSTFWNLEDGFYIFVTWNDVPYFFYYYIPYFGICQGCSTVNSRLDLVFLWLVIIYFRGRLVFFGCGIGFVRWVLGFWGLGVL